VLKQALPEAGNAHGQVASLLVDEFIAGNDVENLLTLSLEVVDSAPGVAARALTHLKDVRIDLLSNAAPRLLEKDWAVLASSSAVPAKTRADIVAAVVVLLQRHQRFAESASLLQALPDELTNDLRFPLLLGTAYESMRQWDRALEQLTRALSALSPSTPAELAESVRLAAATMFERLGRISEALPLLEPEGTTSRPARARCHALRALCQVEMGAWAQAHEDVAAADALMPHSKAVVVILTWTQLGLGDVEEATKRAVDGLRHYPDSEELSFLQCQAEMVLGNDFSKQARRVGKLAATLDPADLGVLFERTLRIRASEEASLTSPVQYFLAVVARAAGRRALALASVHEIVRHLGDEDTKVQPELVVAARRLRAELLEDADPKEAAAEFLAAGDAALSAQDWATSVELLTAADRLGGLDRAGRWKLSEAWYLTSIVPSKPLGIDERALREAQRLWDDTFKEALPDTSSGWTYVSRGLIEMRLARLDRRPRVRFLQTLLYCEAAMVIGGPATSLAELYSDAARSLGLYGLGGEVQEVILAAAPEAAETILNFNLMAANGGFAERARIHLRQLQRLVGDTTWHEEAARLNIVTGDARAALDELAKVAEKDRTLLYTDWLEVVAHSMLENVDGVVGVLKRVRQILEPRAQGAESEEPWLNPALQVLFQVLLGQPDAVSSLLAGMADEDSWWTLSLDAALAGLIRADEDSAEREAVIHGFVWSTPSFEDLLHLRTVVKELRAPALEWLQDRRTTGLDAALGRLDGDISERLREGGWPATAEADIALLRESIIGERPHSQEADEHRLAGVLAEAATARRARRDDDWTVAVDAYRELLVSNGDFPEAEQGLVEIAIWAVNNTQGDGQQVLADVIRRLAEVLPQLNADRRRTSVPDLLETRVGDAYVRLGQLETARGLYKAAAAAAGEASARHVVMARLHVGAAVLGRLIDAPDVDDVLRSCDEAQTPETDVIFSAAHALVRTPDEWERLAQSWTEAVTRLSGRDGQAASRVETLLTEATAQIGWASRREGDLDRAHAELRRAYEMYRSNTGPNDLGVLDRLHDLAMVTRELGRAEDAVDDLRIVVDGRVRLLGAEDGETLAARYDLGAALLESHRPTEAEAEFRVVAQASATSLGEDHLFTWVAWYEVALSLEDQEDFAEAEQLYRKVLDAETRLQGGDDPSTLMTRHRLAAALGAMGRLEEAAAEMRAVAEGRSQVLGHMDAATLAARYELVTILSEQGDLEGALLEIRAVVHEATATLGHDDPITLAARHRLVMVLEEQGQAALAEREYREILAMETRLQGADHPSTIETQFRLATALRSLGRVDEAETELRDVERRASALGSDAAAVKARYEIATLFHEQGRYVEAERMYRDLLEIQRRQVSLGRPETLTIGHQLAHALLSQGRYAEAADVLREVVEGRARVLGLSDQGTLDSRYGLALSLKAAGDLDEAEEHFRAAIVGYADANGNAHSSTLFMREELAALLRELGRASEADAEIYAVDEIRATHTHPQTEE
jgi:tetratricopeptide (TPR) repeat protein